MEETAETRQESLALRLSDRQSSKPDIEIRISTSTVKVLESFDRQDLLRHIVHMKRTNLVLNEKLLEEALKSQR